MRPCSLIIDMNNYYPTTEHSTNSDGKNSEMHTMKHYAISMSKFALSIGSFGVALIVGALISGWLAIEVLVFLTNSQL